MMTEEEEADLYGILGASDREIRLAYHRQSLLYHPDKLVDGVRGKEEIFHRIHKAYTVLSDPDLRRIYDAHGMAGVHARMQVGPVTDSKLAESRVTARLDLSDALGMGPYSADLDWRDRIPSLRGLGASWSATKPLQSAASLRLGYALSMQQGQGIGWTMLGCSWMPARNTSADMTAFLGSRRGVSCGIERIFGGRVAVGGGVDVMVEGGQLVPTLRTSVAGGGGYYGSIVGRIERPLFEETAFYTFGYKKDGIGLEIQSSGSLAVQVKASWPIDRLHTLKMRLGSEGTVRVGLVRAWPMDSDEDSDDEQEHEDPIDPIDSNDNLKTGIYVEMNRAEGCTLLLHLSLGSSWSFDLPILFSPEPTIASLFLTVAAAGSLLLARPEPLKKSLHDDQQRQRADALAIQEIMQSTLPKNDGPVTLRRAVYWSRNDIDDERYMLDVTIPLRAAITKGSLVIEGGRSKAGLLGFYKIPGRPRRLTVWYYLSGGEECCVTVGDLEELVIQRTN